MNTLYNKHIAHVEAVNNSKNTEEHSANQLYLTAWRNGVKDAGETISIHEADMYYSKLGITRPMYRGVWLDWKPEVKL